MSPKMRLTMIETLIQQALMDAMPSVRIQPDILRELASIEPRESREIEKTLAEFMAKVPQVQA